MTTVRPKPFLSLGNPIAYFPRLAAIGGGIDEGVFLSQLRYWTGKEHDRNGWIYKTKTEMTNETELSRYRQDTARKNLVERGLLEERVAGVPGKLHYRLKVDAIQDALDNTPLRDFDQTSDGPEENGSLPRSEGFASHEAKGSLPNTETTTENTTEDNNTTYYGPAVFANIILDQFGVSR